MALTFEELYERHFQDVHRFALWLSGDPSEADDVASETFVRAWVRRDRLRTETLKGYLMAIARTVFVDRRRKARTMAPLPASLKDGAPGPHREMSARRDLRQVRRAMAWLRELDRAALILRAEQEMAYAEIARVLGISEGAARVRVHRARRRLLDVFLESSGDCNGSDT